MPRPESYPASNASARPSNAVRMNDPFGEEDDDISSQRHKAEQWREESDSEEETHQYQAIGSFAGGDISLARNSKQHDEAESDLEASSPASPKLQFDDSPDLGDAIVPVSLEEERPATDPAPIPTSSDLSVPAATSRSDLPVIESRPFSKDAEEPFDRPRTDAEARLESTTPPATPAESSAHHNGEEKHATPESPKDDRAPPPSPLATHHTPHKGDAVSAWSHQQLAPHAENDDRNIPDDDGEWQEMPAFAAHDIYNDDGKIIAKENEEEIEGPPAYSNLGGAAKGYTRVDVDEDAKSANSMDDDTAYLFNKDRGAAADEFDDDLRDATAQRQATKDLLTDNQRIAYVGVVRLALADIVRGVESIERTRGARKEVDLARDTIKLWGQKMMVRLYAHMELDSAEQLMIEQLAEHGLRPEDLTPVLMQNARVRNPVVDEPKPDAPVSDDAESTALAAPSDAPQGRVSVASDGRYEDDSYLPAYKELDGEDMPRARTPSQLPKTEKIDIDLRWTVLCDLFLTLVSGSTYDARSRTLLERVGEFLSVPWLDICRFEKRVTDALEMQQEANKEDWDVDESMEKRRKGNIRKRLVVIGLATVGGGIVIGLSAGLLAPVIGAGLAAGLTTIGVSGTGTFLGGAAGAAVIGSGAALTGGAIGAKAGNRRTGAVKTFEYRPLHNNKRVNLIVTVAGWMTGKVDDVRLPYSTVDPIMGDLYSIHWEPEMLRSMGDTINILATEALTQGLQQILGSTILIGLMAAIQLPMVLSKLAYLIDNPWSNSLARADLAGLILADSLVERSLGSRPITLVGFSLGSRLVFSCLRELTKRGAVGLIQNVYLFGSPVIANKDEYLRVRTIVSGRFVNGYATNDWILGYLFRATSGGLARVAGLAEVKVPGIENINITAHVPGHMSYRTAMPKLLREVGWAITSDEFDEIEDPDPDNHEKRQRELINEIEEARKELEGKPQKGKFFGLFKSKKSLKKKEWETYEESAKAGQQAQSDDPAEAASAAGSVMFDIDALSREVAGIAAQGIQIKEHKSTLPPLRLSPTTSPSASARSSTDVSRSRQMPGFISKANGSASTPPTSQTAFQQQSQQSTRSTSQTYDYDYDPSDHDDHHLASDSAITMTFGAPIAYRNRDSLPQPPTSTTTTTSDAPPRKRTTRFPIANPNTSSTSTATSRFAHHNHTIHPDTGGDLGDSSHYHRRNSTDDSEGVSLSFDTTLEREAQKHHVNGNSFVTHERSPSSPPKLGRKAAPASSSRLAAAESNSQKPSSSRVFDSDGDGDIGGSGSGDLGYESAAVTSALAHEVSASGRRNGAAALAPPLRTTETRNVWADEEEDFGHEKEMEMTFE